MTKRKEMSQDPSPDTVQGLLIRLTYTSSSWLSPYSLLSVQTDGCHLTSITLCPGEGCRTSQFLRLRREGVQGRAQAGQVETSMLTQGTAALPELAEGCHFSLWDGDEAWTAQTYSSLPTIPKRFYPTGCPDRRGIA